MPRPTGAEIRFYHVSQGPCWDRVASPPFSRKFLGPSCSDRSPPVTEGLGLGLRSPQLWRVTRGQAGLHMLRLAPASGAPRSPVAPGRSPGALARQPTIADGALAAGLRSAARLGFPTDSVSLSRWPGGPASFAGPSTHTLLLTAAAQLALGDFLPIYVTSWGVYFLSPDPGPVI